MTEGPLFSQGGGALQNQRICGERTGEAAGVMSQRNIELVRVPVAYGGEEPGAFYQGEKE